MDEYIDNIDFSLGGVRRIPRLQACPYDRLFTKAIMSISESSRDLISRLFSPEHIWFKWCLGECLCTKYTDPKLNATKMLFQKLLLIPNGLQDRRRMFFEEFMKIIDIGILVFNPSPTHNRYFQCVIMFRTEITWRHHIGVILESGQVGFRDSMKELGFVDTYDGSLMWSAHSEI